MYSDLKIVDTSEEVIPRIKQILEEKDMLANDPNYENAFYASDLSENFINMINRIFEKTTYTAAFRNFDLEQFDILVAAHRP